MENKHWINKLTEQELEELLGKIWDLQQNVIVELDVTDFEKVTKLFDTFIADINS